jgi:sugar phosphate permease
MADGRRWTVLAVGTFAQAATCAFIYGIPMLVPALRSGSGLSLFEASLVVSAPMVGLLLTLIAWGAAADRYGERMVIASGVGLAAVLLALAAVVHGTGALGVLLILAGAAGASVNAASGRMVMGWFPARERGLAMGTRQTAQPLGVAIAALALPPLARGHGAGGALLFPALLCAVAAALVLAFVRDPVRSARDLDAAPAGSPYRGSWRLGRVHLASSMLVVPQFAVAGFTLVYLVGERHWDAAAAGRMIFGFQVAGAAGRIVSGVWSDRVGSRLRPMRQLAVASAALMVTLALGAALHSWWIVAAFALGAVVTVADNGLAYTSVAELAGPEWAGRALGVQNTVQNLVAVATAPLLAAIIGDSRYALGFAVVAVFPLIAIVATPVRAERFAGGVREIDVSAARVGVAATPEPRRTVRTRRGPGFSGGG